MEDYDFFFLVPPKESIFSGLFPLKKIIFLRIHIVGAGNGNRAAASEPRAGTAFEREAHLR